MKSIYDHIGMKAMESTVKSALDPTPKHECHVSKNAHKVTSVLAYRAYELTQVVETKWCFTLPQNLIQTNPKFIELWLWIAWSIANTEHLSSCS